MKFCKLKSDGYLYPYSAAMAADTNRFEVVDQQDPAADTKPTPATPVQPPDPAPAETEATGAAPAGTDRPALFARAAALGLNLPRNIKTDAMIAKIAEAEGADAGG